MSYLVRFDDTSATESSLTGGKGANLAVLTQRGFPVPPGFIVIASAYRDFIAPARARIAEWGFAYDDPEALHRQSEALRTYLFDLSLPVALTEQVRRELDDDRGRRAYSVRSSSTLEDLAVAAFAGQHDTFLNCTGADVVLDRIKACFLSLWHDRAIAYRRQQNLHHDDVAMAVVVQSMVQCEVAGVAFSINPISGELQEIVVDSNYGLGESVVSGDADVDHFILEKRTGAVRSRRLGNKRRKIVGNAQGTEEAAVPETLAAEPSLDTGSLRTLAEIINKIEASYGFPQDVEWGFADRQLHVLQSRPITAIPPRWTREESAERFPNAMTPLPWELIEDGFHRSLNFSLRLMGRPPFNGKWFAMHGNYIYGNQNAVEIYARALPFSLTSLDQLRSAIPVLRENFRWVQELPVLWSRDLDRYLLGIGEFMAESLDDKDLREVWRYVQRVNTLGTDYFQPNIAISITQSMLHKLLLGVLRLAVGDDATRLFDALLAYCETKTGAVNKEMVEMALLVRADENLRSMFEETLSRDMIANDALAAFPAFQRRLQRFLRDHGHREVDIDPYVAPWIESPWIVLDNIRLMARAESQEQPAQKERTLKIRSQEAEFELFNRLEPDLHFFFHELIRLARTYTALDDMEHYQTTRLTLPLRRGLRALGERLRERGVVHEPDDVYFAHLEPLSRAIDSDAAADWAALAGMIAEEKNAYFRHRALSPSWSLGSSQATNSNSGKTLLGIAGSAGRAQGCIYIVRGPEDFGRFPKGAVLVARTTNPAWTPLFYTAAAVVTESGGPLSHGAVTAREMGIPAVMGVHGLLSLLSNGQSVHVDGAAGQVVLLDTPLIDAKGI